MTMLANRSPAGFCLCKRCVKPDERRGMRKRNRLREEREWRRDAEPPSWASDEAEYVLWLDEESARYEDPPPPGFDGVWSTGHRYGG